MKQKNLILMVVAVGCGLLAAFLTSQMSAKPSAAPPHIDVLMVAKELPPGTKFTADSIKDQFKIKQSNPEMIPEKAVTSADLLDGKTLNKTLRVDDFVRESDLGNYEPLKPPFGKHVVCLRAPVDKMTPFVQPNSHIDLIGTMQTKDAHIKTKILIPNMLVMAVDVQVTPPNGPTKGDLAIQLASLAATQEEALAIAIAEAANVKFRFILRSDNTSTDDPDWSLAKVTDWISNDDNKKEDTTKNPTEPGQGPAGPATETTTKMTVPTSDLTAGTELTTDLVQAKFKEVSVVGAPPSNAVLNIKEHVGRFLVKDVAADQFVPKNYIADKLVAKDARGVPDSGPSTKEDPSLPVKKLPTFDRTYTTTSGVKTYRYEIQEDGEKKLLGEVQPDGNVVSPSNAGPSAPNTAAPPAPPKKDN